MPCQTFDVLGFRAIEGSVGDVPCWTSPLHFHTSFHSQTNAGAIQLDTGNNDAHLTIDRTEIRGNTAGDETGGIRVSSGELILGQVFFEDNVNGADGEASDVRLPNAASCPGSGCPAGSYGVCTSIVGYSACSSCQIGECSLCPAGTAMTANNSVTADDCEPVRCSGIHTTCCGEARNKPGSTSPHPPCPVSSRHHPHHPTCYHHSPPVSSARRASSQSNRGWSTVTQSVPLATTSPPMRQMLTDSACSSAAHIVTRAPRAASAMPGRARARHADSAKPQTLAARPAKHVRLALMQTRRQMPSVKYARLARTRLRAAARTASRATKARFPPGARRRARRARAERCRQPPARRRASRAEVAPSPMRVERNA